MKFQKILGVVFIFLVLMASISIASAHVAPQGRAHFHKCSQCNMPYNQPGDYPDCNAARGGKCPHCGQAWSGSSDDEAVGRIIYFDQKNNNLYSQKPCEYLPDNYLSDNYLSGDYQPYDYQSNPPMPPHPYYHPDDAMVDDILRAADASLGNAKAVEKIIMNSAYRIRTLKGLLRLAGKLYSRDNFNTIARYIERPGTIVNASIEDVSQCCSEINGVSPNASCSDRIILACARRFRNTHDISLLMEEAIGESTKKELAKIMSNCAGVYGNQSYYRGKASGKLNDNLFAGNNKLKNVSSKEEIETSKTLKAKYSDGDIVSGITNIAGGGNNINLKNSAGTGSFSGNQRSAMLFGNQIEDSADSVSVPGKKEKNNHANVSIDQLVTMSEKELYQLLGKQLAELGYGFNYELKPIAGETFSYNSKQYYVLIPRTHLKSFINNCEYFKAVPVICNPSHVHEKLGKVGVVVEPKGSKMALDMIKNYNGRPLDKVVLYAIVLCNDLKTKPVKTILVGDKLEGDFKKCSGILNKMTKNPYGQRASMFRNIAKYYPGMLEKLPVTEIESNGKIYKQFEFPVVHLVLGAPDMNGKGKHVILSHEHYVYTLVKYLPKQIRK